MASIVVTGDVLRRPTGSNLAVHLHYLIGLRKLGHQVAYLEDRAAPDPIGDGGTVVPREGLLLLENLLRRTRVDVPVVWVDADAGLVGGMDWAQLHRRLRGADLLLDLGGHCSLQERALPRRRVLLDIDGARDGHSVPRQADHDLFFSNRRDPDELLAAEWLPTIPPVVPRLWYGPPARAELPLKVLVGRGFEEGGLGPHQGEGSAEQLLALPARLTPRPWTTLPDDRSELAARLSASGWSVRAEAAVDASLSVHRAQLIGSQACLSLHPPEEEGVWFTSHNACFLAAGRPLIAPAGDLDCWVPTGAGLLTFGDLDGAVEAVELVVRELPRHAAAARDLAERVFHFRVVLPSLLEQALPRHLQAVA